MTEIKQTRPFASLEEEALLNLVRSADHVTRSIDEFLAAHGLSSEQYNVLRILRGAGPAGLPCGEIGARMLTRNPDVTRLLDRLAAQGLATRRRGSQDRRVVTAYLSRKGLKLLGKLDAPLHKKVRDTLKHFSRPDLRTAIHLLEAMRRSTGGPKAAGKSRITLKRNTRPRKSSSRR